MRFVVVPWRSATLLEYDVSSSVVLSERPPKVLKTEALNRNPVNSSRPPGGKDASGAEHGQGTPRKTTFSMRC